MNKPLVSVICLCHNNEAYVEEAIRSVLNQDYPNVELIAVDDASTDNSEGIIRQLQEKHGFQAIFNKKNLGNNRSFNLAYRHSKGAFLIDLAADDILLPGRIKEGVSCLNSKGKNYGVHFCDAELIDEAGKSLGTHYRRDSNGQLLLPVMEGDLYATLLGRYYISAPTMMMKRKVLDDLDGYDENLAYEDFDFWVRSARKFLYAFTDAVLVQKRILKNSLSSRQRSRNNKHCLSTAMVCQKALNMNISPEETLVLLRRIHYELKWALITESWDAARLFLEIKHKLKNSTWDGFLNVIIRIRPSWYWLWKLVLKL